MIRINYKPEPEFMINVNLESGKVKQVHAKNIKKITEMKEMRNLIGEQTNIVPPIIKNQEYQVILDGLWANMENLKPVAGTNPIDMLKKYIIDYVNGPQATTFAAFKSGAVLKDEEFYYFDYDNFYEVVR